ncbi:MAG: DUF5067 domain-containing protein [Lachnospiraceae bacterium]|nr:DUF5067 domain-containing protein [Lachnospiraceae bacterium]
MKKLLAFILIFCLVSGMTVYAAEDMDAEGDAQATVFENRAGGYKLTGIVSDTGDSLGIVSAALDLGVDFYLVLDEDGTGYMSFLEANIPLSWEDDRLIFGEKDDADDADPDDDDDDEYDEDDEDDDDSFAIPYEYAGGLLKIRTEAYSMDFIRMTDDEFEDYKENGGTGLGSLAGMLVQNLLGNTGIGDLIETLVFELALGSMGPSEVVPIPEGEPSEGPVTGIVEGMEITILGADLVRGQKYTWSAVPDEEDEAEAEDDDDDDEDDEDEGDAEGDEEAIDEDDVWLIVFYYDVTNLLDEPSSSWWFSLDADNDWDDEFLDWGVLDIPEENNNSLNVAPGRTVRCATGFECDPEDGVVGFRISSYHDESSLLYYADPMNLSGAPEPFVYDADPSIPEYLTEVPEEAEDICVEKAEFFTNEEGTDCVRFWFTFKNTTDAACTFVDVHNWYAMQDGIEVNWIRGSEIEEEENCWAEVEPGEELSCATSFRIRTASPVVIVFTVEEEDGTEVPVTAWVGEAE